MSRVLSGIQPTGQIHIGNYLGAIRQWAELQDEHELFIFIADLHAITLPYEHKTYQETITTLAQTLFNLGLNPKKTTVFKQSDIPEHTELAWLLNCLTVMGELERMTQYKEKAMGKHSVSIGLFDYPVLQAADILLYQTALVPVGEDQIQHIELTRDLRRRFAARFGTQPFTEPKPLVGAAKRVMSLHDPTKKMSKSHGAESTILVDDDLATIKRKIAKAPTATEFPDLMPAGVKNLFFLLKVFGTPQALDKYMKSYENHTTSYSELKATLAEAIHRHFDNLKKKASSADMNQVLREGAAKARPIAQKTLREVKTAMGLV